MGTILVETGSIWRRIFLLDPVTASEEQKAGLVRVLRSRYHKVCAGEPQLHETRPQTIARMARALMPDAWTIYSKTVSFFGYTVDEPRIPYVLESHRRSPPGQGAPEAEPIHERLLSA